MAGRRIPLDVYEGNRRLLFLLSSKHRISPLICLMLFLTLITSISPTHSDQSKVPLTVCKSLKSGKQFISKTGKCNERIYEARDWYEEGTVPTGTPGSKLIALNLCTSKKSQISLIREKCNPRTQHSDTYQRSYGPPGSATCP